METTKLYDVLELQKMKRDELVEIAKLFKLNIYQCEPKQSIIYQILDAQAEKLNSKS